MKLLEKVFYTSFQRFEKINRGRVITTIGNDTAQLGGSANILVQLITSAVTTLGAFLYLAAIAFWATAVTVLVIAAIATLYTIVTRRTQIYFEEARDTQNVFMSLLNGIIDGFKELSLQYNKKKEYKKEIGENVDEFRAKSSTAFIKFVNAFLIGESLLIIVLGSVGYGIPRLFPEITPVTLMGFIMVLLYLIGPVNGILNAIPTITQLRVSWNRIQGFIKDIPANMDPKDIEALDHSNPGSVEYIKAKGLMFTYDARNDSERFVVGPMDFEAQKGQIVFVIGGNGSGKTTLAKILTGLYLPDEGSIKIDGKEINSNQLGEYYSAVFGDYHLFERLYNVDVTGREAEIQEYLELLRLDEKVVLEDDRFSTLDLSGGQRKRLALLQCYLEDRPIYLFDEVAADQDPGFRKFFYRELLKRMKEKGKIVIAITHDDHYFDVADKIVKMDMGKIDVLEEGEKQRLSVTS
jgi:cyclic peptide transporter